jgi:peptide/nickel transport system ATP-binding protein
VILPGEDDLDVKPRTARVGGSETGELLSVRAARKVFRLGGLLAGKEIVAVDEVSFSLFKDKPDIFSIIGESGSGKTTLSRMILRLLLPDSGTIELDGTDVHSMKGRRAVLDYMRKVQPVFQNPFETFNALDRVDEFLHETARNYFPGEPRKQGRERVERALNAVGLSLSEVGGRYPHELSGGQLQRASIARAILPGPSILVADEPVSMVDASLRMSIVNLFQDLKNRTGTSIIYITHDLATAYYISDRIAIIHKGFFVEQGDTASILTAPRHPYTRLLVESALDPRPGATPLVESEVVVGGEDAATGCAFAARCPQVKDVCRQRRPPPIAEEGRQVRCFLYGGDDAR